MKNPMQSWISTIISDQESANKYIPTLLATKADLHFVIYTPSVSECVDFTSILMPDGDALGASLHNHGENSRIGWIIFYGADDGTPCFIDHARTTLVQCRTARIPFFCKQLGSVPIIADPPRSGLAREKWPEREWPEGTFFGSQGLDLQGPYGYLRGRVAILKDPKGEDMNEWPIDLRVREIPD